MASLDFYKEKRIFRAFHSNQLSLMESATSFYCTLISTLLADSGGVAIAKIAGRVKDKEECIRKFNLKYRKSLEENASEYSIKEHISDLIGLRVVCLYEDDIETIRQVLKEHFEIIDMTDKTALLENTEGSFGYKGLHLDLKLAKARRNKPEDEAFVDLVFELQIRTIIQDSWSTLDHRIKYKKSIPNHLKRRINTLAALFELADREFKEIRISTDAEIRKIEQADSENPYLLTENINPVISSKKTTAHGRLTVFGLLKIARHFFSDYEFDAHKIDGFTEEIVLIKTDITRADFHQYMVENISRVKAYKDYCGSEEVMTDEKFTPFTTIRHCLYLSDKELFTSILTNVAKEVFEGWLKNHGQQGV